MKLFTEELTNHLEDTLKTVYDIEIKINIQLDKNGVGEIILGGYLSDLEEIKSHIFIQGFLHGWHSNPDFNYPKIHEAI